MKLTLTFDNRPPIELDMPRTPPDHAKLVEAIVDEIDRAQRNPNEMRTATEVAADAALAFFAESAVTPENATCVFHRDGVAYLARPGKAGVNVDLPIYDASAPAPVRYVVPGPVRVFVAAYGFAHGDSQRPLNDLWLAARAAIESLDNSTADVGRSSTVELEVVGSSPAAPTSAPSTQAMTDEEIGLAVERIVHAPDGEYHEVGAKVRALLAPPNSLAAVTGSRAAVPESVRAYFENYADDGWMRAVARTNAQSVADIKGIKRDLAALDTGDFVLVERGELERLRRVDNLHGADGLTKRCEAAERRASDAEARYTVASNERSGLAVQVEALKERATAVEAKLAEARTEIDALKVTAMRFNDLSEILGAQNFEGPTGAARRVVAERDSMLTFCETLLDAKNVVHPCSYCDWKGRIEPTDALDTTRHLRDHVEFDCPNHPLRKVEAERDAALARFDHAKCVFNGYPFETWIKAQIALHAATNLLDPFEAVERLIDVKDAALARKVEVVLPNLTYRQGYDQLWLVGWDRAINNIQSANPTVSFVEGKK